ncbi:hypothetical protein AMTR_s00112p00148490 [Amborella trichopoda]|uniref:Uncharacterized protein n=1 Tax=Amborella trichopoda TaxID=13333 RepID=W1NWW7_AMBTC|nr:hypothetical protein AMTR_s00112p00148490 [Amborella trichopoda]
MALEMITHRPPSVTKTNAQAKQEEDSTNTLTLKHSSNEQPLPLKRVLCCAAMQHELVARQATFKLNLKKALTRLGHLLCSDNLCYHWGYIYNCLRGFICKKQSTLKLLLCFLTSTLPCQ